MSSKLDRRVNAFRKSDPTLSHQAALAILQTESVAPLLTELRTKSTFNILVGRVPAVGASADFTAAQQQASQLRENVVLFAKSGAVETQITPTQSGALLRCGAADDRTTQVVRTFHAPQGTTFSERCEKCDRWIWCGTEEREDACVCGHTYRIAFDLAPVYHWNQERGRRCMDCGAEYTPTDPREGRNPWRLQNEWQTRCNACHKPMRKEIHARYYGGRVTGQYVTVRPSAEQGETIEDAIAELRGDASKVPDLLQAEVRRTDVAGHPRVCVWERESPDHPWVFAWGSGADDPSADPIALIDFPSEPMDDVIETLMKACGILGIQPTKPFPTVQDFEAMLLELYPAFEQQKKLEQLQWALKAAREAEGHSVGGVAACIKRVRLLEQVGKN